MTTTIKPMLGVAVEARDVQYPIYASAKLDGVRGLVIDGKLRSRSLKPIPNRHVTALFSRPELEGIDGEIIVGEPNAKDVCRATMAACAREAFAPAARFYVFDDFSARGSFIVRLDQLTRRIAALPADVRERVVLLPQMLIHDERELLAYEEHVLALGFEGLILRNPASPYKQGRSTVREGGMLKVKRFTDSEAKIVAIVEEQHNTNAKTTNELGRGQRSSCKAGLIGKGRMGALTVRDLTTGIEFNVGAGFDDADRAYFWLQRERVIGQVVKYKSFQIGVKDAPRFPIYLGGRESWDMGEAA